MSDLMEDADRKPHWVWSLYEKGLTVFPLNPVETPPGRFIEERGSLEKAKSAWPKMPMEKSWAHWQKMTPDYRQIEAWLSRSPNCNFAIVTGKEIDVVDADDDAAVRFVTENLTRTPWTVKTGGGRHFYYQKNPGLTLKNSSSQKAKLDTRGFGGYVVAPGSRHSNGCVYRLEEAPDWPVSSIHDLPCLSGDDLKKIWEYKDGCSSGGPHLSSGQEWVKIGGPITEAPWTDAEWGEIRSAFEYINWDDRDEWFQAAAAVRWQGQQGFSLWDEFSQRSSKYNHQDSVRVWNSIKNQNSGPSLTKSSIFAIAQSRGWQNPMKVPRVKDDFDPSRVFVQPEKAAPAPAADFSRLPSDALNEAAQWMVRSVFRTTTPVAVLGSIALASVVAGRVYRTEADNYASILSAVIGRSGSGKDLIKQAVTRTLVDSGLPELLGPASFTSEAAIRTQFLRHPTKVFVIDEFGDKLKKAMADANPNELAAFDSFKEIYSNAGGVWAERGYAMARDVREALQTDSNQVHNPSLTLVGLATPEQFVRALDGARMEGGFLNRFIIVDASDSAVIKRRSGKESAPPQWLIDRVQAIRAHGMGGELHSARNSSFSLPASPRTVVMRPGVSDRFFDAWDHYEETLGRDPVLGNLASRWHENAMRLACAIAVFEDYREPAITLPLAEWCLGYVEYHGRRFAALCEQYAVTEETEYSKQLGKMLHKLREAGADGISLKQMNSLSVFKGISSQARTHLLNDMQEKGLAMCRKMTVKRANGSETEKTVWFAATEND